MAKQTTEKPKVRKIKMLTYQTVYSDGGIKTDFVLDQVLTVGKDVSEPTAKLWTGKKYAEWV